MDLSISSARLSSIAAIAVTQVCIGTVNALLLGHVTSLGVSTAQTLLWRGGGSAVLAIGLSLLSKETLIPKQPRVQGVRFIVAGVAISLTIATYSYLPPSIASLVARMDLPILFLLGGIFGYAVLPKQRILSGLAILALGIALFVSPGNATVAATGVAVGLCGAGTVALGYLFLRRSFSTESRSVTILVPSAACAIIGLIGSGPKLSLPDRTLTPSLLALGACMFALYYLSGRMYRLLPNLGSEFPAMLVPLAVLTPEIVLMARPTNLPQVLGLTISAACVLVALYIGAKNHEPS